MKEDSVVSIEEPTTNKDVLTEVRRSQLAIWFWH